MSSPCASSSPTRFPHPPARVVSRPPWNGNSWPGSMCSTTAASWSTCSSIELSDASRSTPAGLALVDEYLEGANPFPERTHANILWMTLVRDLHLLLIDWADHAIEEVGAWDDSTRGGDPRELMAQLVELPDPGRARGLNP